VNAVPDWSAVEDAMDRAVDGGVFPGAVLLAARADEVLFHRGFGKLDEAGPDVTAATVYDVSSLTKPLVTAACVLKLVAAGKLSLDRPVADVLPDWACDGEARRGTVTLADLMAHRSGLPARSLYFERLGAAAAFDPADRTNSERIIGWATAEPLAATPGMVSVYSDVGFIVLGAIVERIAGASLDEVFESEFGNALAADASGFRPVKSPGSQKRADAELVAPTGFCPWRGRIVCGEVQDENAWAMGGVAGHAGLFATAEDIHRLTLAYVRANSGLSSQLDSALVRRVWSGPFARDSTWALGWDTPTPGESSAGARISARSFGHLGFTGASVWVDLERGVHVILLSNRVHPDPGNVAIRTFRPQLHDAVFDVLDVASSAGTGKGHLQ
jgi:CubicO group peptidase (beta-lactamase class C family)